MEHAIKFKEEYFYTLLSSRTFTRCHHFLICLILELHLTHVFTDPLTLHLAQVYIYFYVVRKHCHNHKERGVVEYTYQDSVRKIPSRNFEKIFLEKFPAQSLPLFMYTGSIKLKIRNHHFPPTSL